MKCAATGCPLTVVISTPSWLWVCMRAWPRAHRRPRLTGWAGLPSSLMGRASRVLTMIPQPAGHSRHTLA